MANQDPSNAADSTPPSTASLGEVVRELFGFVSVRGKQEVGRLQEKSRHQLEIRQIRKDRDKRLEKLGKETMALVAAGEVQHPGLEVHMAHVRDLEARLVALMEAGPSSHSEQPIRPEE